MKEAELKALYIRRIQELMQQYKLLKYQALSAAYRPLIEEVTPLHTSSMAAAVSVAIVQRKLIATGKYDKKQRSRIKSIYD